MRASLFTILVLSVLIVGVDFSHSGRTNSDGCHTDRKTGKVHCH
jgi:hypothetical protein